MACFDVPDEQLYLLEVIVNCLNLTDEKLYECDERPLHVRIKFLELPILTLSQFDFECVKNLSANGKRNDIAFGSGQSCLFGKRPKSLVEEMKKTPARIGIFCDDETYAIAETTLKLSGCMCDQIAMAVNDKEHLPKPFSMEGKYNLIDPGENISGWIDIEFKLTCLGKYVTTHYQMRKNTFVFKNDRNDGQYFVQRILANDEETPKAPENYSEDVKNELLNAPPEEKKGKKEKKKK